MKETDGHINHFDVGFLLSYSQKPLFKIIYSYFQNIFIQLYSIVEYEMLKSKDCKTSHGNKKKRINNDQMPRTKICFVPIQRTY